MFCLSEHCIEMLICSLQHPQADNKLYLLLMCVEKAFEFHLTYKPVPEALIRSKQMYLSGHSELLPGHCVTEHGFRLRKAAVTLQ